MVVPCGRQVERRLPLAGLRVDGHLIAQHQRASDFVSVVFACSVLHMKVGSRFRQVGREEGPEGDEEAYQGSLTISILSVRIRASANEGMACFIDAGDRRKM